MTLDQIVCDAEFPDFSQLLQCSGLDCLDQVTDMKGTVHFCGGPCFPPPPPPPAPQLFLLLQCNGLDCLDQVTDMKGAVLFCGAPPLPSLPPSLLPPLPPSSTPSPPPLPPSPQLFSAVALQWVGLRVSGHTHQRCCPVVVLPLSLPPHPPIFPFPPTPSLSPPPHPPHFPLSPQLFSAAGGPPSVSHFNPFTAVLAALSLEKWPIEVPDFKSLSFFLLGKIWSELKLVWCLLLTFKVVYQDHLTQLLPCAWDFVAKRQWLVWGQVG